MTVAAPLLTRRAVLQVAVESVYRQEAAVGVNDALYVEEPDYAVDVNLLERDFARDDLSPLANIVGRRLASMTFTTELKGNGAQHSGLASDAPLIARLFRACGYSLTEIGASDITPVFPIGNHTNEVDWSASGGSATGTLTATDQPADGETVTIGTKVYTFEQALTDVDGNVAIGATLAATLLNLSRAINGTGGVPGTDYASSTTPHPDVRAEATATTVEVTALTVGSAGNGITTGTNVGDFTWGGGTLAGGAELASNADVIGYFLEVTTGGASGVAEITVSSDTPGEGSAAAVVTSGTPFSLGTHGLEITPNFSGDLPVGTKWVVWLLSTGLKLDPISDEFESLTMVLNMDGVQHKMLGSFGTFTVNAEAGDYARIEWEFQGTFEDPTDMPMPICNYEKSLPSQVELARLRIDSDYTIVNAFSYTQNNDIQIRPDVSSKEGYVGTRIVSRSPEGGIDPEAELVANHDFWGKMGKAERMSFQMRVGTDRGNTVWFLAPSVQYTGLTYQDRNGIRTYDAQLKFSRVLGNDEFSIFLC